MIEQRKDEHIDICANERVKCNHNYWDDIMLLTHRALPGLDYQKVDTGTEFLGKEVSAPVMISAITGGSERGGEVNAALAEAAARARIPMEVGSIRPAIKESEQRITYSVLSDFDVPVRIANLGIPQFLDNGSKRYGPEEIEEAMSIFEADAIAIHMNFLQEVVQVEGDTDSTHGLEALLELADDYPIIAKETGAGIGPRDLENLSKGKFKAVDISGVGGTSFSAVEYYRARKEGEDLKTRLGLTLWDWGIPSPLSLIDAFSLRKKTEGGHAIIASGGMRTGLDAFRGLLLGADMIGYSGAFLSPGVKGSKAGAFLADALIAELKAAMFLSGLKNIVEVKALAERGPSGLCERGKIAITGPLFDILRSRGDIRA